MSAFLAPPGEALESLSLSRVERHGKRFYDTPDGLFPSVTTVLGIEEKQWVAAWEARVGIEEADRVRARALAAGTALHECMEAYVAGTPESDLKFATPRARTSFLAAKRAVVGRLTRVVGQELRMYSTSLRLAGTCDVVGDWDGVPAVVDYKTSNASADRVDESEFGDYFLQAAAYAAMLYERYGRVTKKLVVVFALNDDATPVVLEKKLNGSAAGDLLQRVLKFEDWLKKIEKETTSCVH